MGLAGRREGIAMRAIFNRRENIVSESLDGLVAASGGRLVRFAPDSHARVVLRGDWDKTRVAIVSGGGSGHEPAHAGLVGKGLLAAAVCGEIFASPSVDAVLSAIIAVTGPSGCLLVVKNYTGDRLNFGLAAEKAKTLGLKVEMVIVADDIALPDATQPRGLAGTLFVHKIAGHMSESGCSLAEIVSFVESIKARIFTIGAARDTCTVPGSPKQNRIGPDEMEIGLGIHGEAGIELARIASSRDLVENLSARLRPRIQPNAQYAVLFNNLGGLSGLECSVLLSDLLQTSLAHQIKLVAGPASVMTALDMPGFSISFLELTDELERAIQAPVGPTAFPQFERVGDTHFVITPESGLEQRYEPSSNPRVRKVVEVVAATCIEMEAAINTLDAKVGDGDTGSTFAAAARSVGQLMNTLPFDDGGALMSNLSEIKRRTMGGSSGVLFAILLARGAEEYRRGESWIASLIAGLEAVQRYGGANLGDRTMVDALWPALLALNDGHGLRLAALRAREGADSTSKMLRAGAGRSSYLEARSLDGINDPGAEAVARIFEALAINLAPGGE